MTSMEAVDNARQKTGLSSFGLKRADPFTLSPDCFDREN